MASAKRRSSRESKRADNHSSWRIATRRQTIRTVSTTALRHSNWTTGKAYRYILLWLINYYFTVLIIISCVSSLRYLQLAGIIVLIVTSVLLLLTVLLLYTVYRLTSGTREVLRDSEDLWLKTTTRQLLESCWSTTPQSPLASLIFEPGSMTPYDTQTASVSFFLATSMTVPWSIR